MHQRLPKRSSTALVGSRAIALFACDFSTSAAGSQHNREVFVHVLAHTPFWGQSGEARHSRPGPGRSGRRASAGSAPSEAPTRAAARVRWAPTPAPSHRGPSAPSVAPSDNNRRSPWTSSTGARGRRWSTTAPTYMSTWSGSGYKMVWGVPILPNSFHADSNPSDTSGSAYGLEQGAAGAYNSYFLKLAQEMVAGGQGSSIIRPGWEFNGNWFPWAAKGAGGSLRRLLAADREHDAVGARAGLQIRVESDRGRPRRRGPRRLLPRERLRRLHRPRPLRPVLGARTRASRRNGTPI